MGTSVFDWSATTSLTQIRALRVPQQKSIGTLVNKGRQIMEQQGESAQGPQDTGNLAIRVPVPCLVIRICFAISITPSFLIFCDPFVDVFLVWLKKHKLQAYYAPLEEVILIST